MATPGTPTANLPGWCPTTATSTAGFVRDREWVTVSMMSDHPSDPPSDRRASLGHPEDLLDSETREELHAHLERMARSRRNVKAASATLRFG